MNKYYKILELDKVLNMLSKKTSCDDSKIKAESIEPSSDFLKVNQLLKETSDAHMLIAKFAAPSFNGLSSIEVIIKKACAKSVLNNAELLKIAENLHVFNLLENFKEQAIPLETSLNERFKMVVPNKYLENKIKSCILSESEVSDDASLQLFSIRKKICKISESIREQLDKMIRSSKFQKYLQENIVTIKSDRFVLPIRAEFRKEVDGLVHETSSSGATVFIEPSCVVDANNDIKILQQEEKKEIEKILKELSEEVSGFAENILISYRTCVELDVIFAKAKLAYSMDAILPKINKAGHIMLKHARHPLIDKKKVVPICVYLGKTFNSLVITGPNTGGKTVTLKTVGLFALMTMCGLMIPASQESEVCIFEYILADIGDEQSIEQSLSTFSSHMVNIVKILAVANEKSLILLDELGAGTDPVEGAALAIAILEHLKQKGCKVLATTHYSELKSYALSTLNVENACCEFDIKTLKPKYNLLIGVPGSSNAFAISKRLGMPEDIIIMAKNFISDDNLKFENVVKSLDSIKTNLEEEKNNLKKIKEQLNVELDFVEKEKEYVKKWRKIEFEKAKTKSEKMVLSAKSMAIELIEEIKNIKKFALNNDDSIKKLKNSINKIDKIIDPVENYENLEYKLPRDLKVGDNVLIFDINKEGIVLDISSDKKSVTVQTGVIKTKVSINNIRLLKEKKIKNQNSNSLCFNKNIRNKTKSVKTEIDLRGKTVLEAEVELDAFIDNAVLFNIKQITIIHGKGTGILRAEIAKYLKKHPNIKSFRLGNFGEGESGVTIVELK